MSESNLSIVSGEPEPQVAQDRQGFDPRVFSGRGLGGFNGFFREHRDITNLPPKKFLQTPDRPIQTPLNEFGLVDVPRTIELVESFVKPGYVWGEDETPHHLQYPRVAYLNLRGMLVDPLLFRNLPTNILALPTDCEDLLHETLIDPPVPDEKVMADAVKAWRSAFTFYRSARMVVRKTRQADRYMMRPTSRESDLELLMQILAKKQRGVSIHRRSLEEVPEGMRIIEPADSLEDLAVSIARVGQMATKGYRRYELRRKALSLAA